MLWSFCFFGEIMEIRGKFIDDRIIEFLSKKNIKTEEEIDSFLNPKIENLLDPFLLANMTTVCARIQTAVKRKEKIVIYGDYDCDGICASSMLFLFLRGLGADVDVFIPNRFSDGYGISDETVDIVAQKFDPKLVITVDCGITAVNEVEKFKGLGIEVIVTDHHEPAKVLPNCLVIDPKVKNQNYGFDGLSGAGVVFKLIHAMSGVEVAMRYVDICAISTVGDIVPLLSENRIITHLGLEKLNAEKARPFVKHIRERLEIKKINSSELSFKIVPRINASGRMDNSMKCFEYFVATDPKVLDEKFELIEADNSERLRQSSLVTQKIGSQIENADFENSPAIFIYDSGINLGIIGIIASKLCATYHRPVFVFTDAESGLLKGSVRSIAEINIFEIMSKFSDLLVDIGGHELAGGLTINRQNFKTFEEKIQSHLKQNFSDDVYEEGESFDIEVQENDLSLRFAEQIEMLEPFGHENKTPICRLYGKKFDYVQMKSFKHFRILSPKKREIISFFGHRYTSVFETEAPKKLFFDISNDVFLGHKKVKCILKNLSSEIERVECEEECARIKALSYFAQSLRSKNAISYNFFSDFSNISSLVSARYGTLVVADNFETFETLQNLFSLGTCFFPDKCGRTKLMYNPYFALNASDLLLYKNVIFADGEHHRRQAEFLSKNIFVKVGMENTKAMVLEREQFAKIFRMLSQSQRLAANNFIDLATLLATRYRNFSRENFALYLAVASELGFVNLEYSPDQVSYERIDAAERRKIDSSIILQDCKK